MHPVSNIIDDGGAVLQQLPPSYVMFPLCSVA